MGRLPQTSGNLPMACIWKEFRGTSEGCHQLQILSITQAPAKWSIYLPRFIPQIESNSPQFMYLVADEAPGIYQTPFSIS